MINPFKKYKVDHFFFRSFSLFIILVLGCTVWASYRISSAELAKTTSYYQQQLLDELNSEISARLITIEQISLSTSRDNELLTLLAGKQDKYDRYRQSKSVEQALANLTYSIPLIQGIDLYMKEPWRTDTRSYIQFKDVSEVTEQVWYDALQNNDFAWSREHTVRSFQGDVPVISFIRQLVYDDSYIGTLVIHVKAANIGAMLAGQNGTANRMMIDAAGRQLLTIGEVPSESELSEWVSGNVGQSGTAQIDSAHGRKDTLLVYSKLSDSNWMLVEVTPWQQITAGSIRLAEVIGLIGIAAVLLALILTHLLSRQFTRPIKQLVEAMGSYSVTGKKTELPFDYENEFGYLFAGYRKQNERIEALYLSLRERHEQQRKAEIEALQANINPHFLYNTLDQLNWMAIASGQHEMSRILELMGRMFRIGLSNGEPFITIEDEMTHISCYLEIQQLRWGSGLEYTLTASPALRKLYIPKMLLQPFVENSVVHGFNARSSGWIGIRIEQEGERLIITIEDDGSGLLRKVEEEPRRKTGGYGIRNVRERIAAYFGDPYGAELSARAEGGTCVTIVLPLVAERPEAVRDGKGG